MSRQVRHVCLQNMLVCHAADHERRWSFVEDVQQIRTLAVEQNIQLLVQERSLATWENHVDQTYLFRALRELLPAQSSHEHHGNAWSPMQQHVNRERQLQVYVLRSIF